MKKTIVTVVETIGAIIVFTFFVAAIGSAYQSIDEVRGRAVVNSSHIEEMRREMRREMQAMASRIESLERKRP